ncbi:MAG: phosphoribosylanthranilate isomerase [Promethearchaeota archaeon]
MEYVKICGLKDPVHIKLCREYGANAVGFIYNVPNSPRNLEKNDLLTLMRKAPKDISRVIVNRSNNLSDCVNIMNEINADYYQFHCNFSLQEFDKLPINMTKKIIVGMKLTQANKDFVIKKINFSSDQFFSFLLDNSEGQGTELDYDFILEVLRKTYGSKIIIAGGISIDNIEYLIKNLNPFGIDASSSLESEKGIKDSIKIKKFLNKIKEIKSDIESET